MLEVLIRAVIPRKTCLTCALGHIKHATCPSGVEPAIHDFASPSLRTLPTTRSQHHGGKGRRTLRTGGPMFYFLQTTTMLQQLLTIITLYTNKHSGRL